VITGFLADWFRQPRKAAPFASLPTARPDDLGASVEEIRRLLEVQEQAYQSSTAEIKARLVALEGTSSRPPSVEPARKT
jgi:hypothetical protein